MDNIPDYNRLKKCKKKAEEKDDLKEVATVCNALGELLSQYGYHKEAMEEHEMEKHISEVLQDKIGEAVACRKIGECLCKLGQFDKALKFQKHYLSLAQDCNNQVEVQRALATLGDTYYNQADAQSADHTRLLLLDQAEKKFLQALRVCSELRGSSTLTESEYMAMKGRLLLNLGLVYDVRGAEKESTEYLQKALTIAKQWQLDEEQYLCHFNAANQALRSSGPSDAKRSLQEALTLATKLHDKPRQREALCQLAIASVMSGDTKSAKHFLKKAYKILPSTDESHKLIKLYKAVSAVEELREQQQGAGEEQDDSVLFHTHEKLGDAFTEIAMYCGCYVTAIQHYKMMVECGERQGLGADKLIPAYVSLAQTYADNRQPDLAIANYRKELDLRGEDHEQICRTLLNIAELEEKKGDGYKVLSKTYTTAFSHAKKANHPRLQVQVLRSLILTQELFKEHRHKEQTEAKLRHVQAKHGIGGQEEEEEDSQPQDSEEQGPRDSEEEDDLSIADLTESDKSDEENVRPVLSHSVGTARVRRMKTFKKNEKGETPLHVACINGNLKRVKTLLAEGHPVNVRDHCGWTPLHEAANHNYPAVVEELLNAGAHINDRGGAECSGLTPLIDAAACGNLAIVELLIERGANVLAKDDKGCTALQALRDWHRDYADTSDQDLMAHYNAVILMFQEKVSGRKASGSASSQRATTSRAGGSGGSSGDRPGSSQQGSGGGVRHSSHSALSSQSQHHSLASSSPPLPPQGSTRRHPTSHATNSRKRLPEDIWSSDEEEEDIYHNPQLSHLRTSPKSATETYRSSILALGSSTHRAEVRASMSTTPSKPGTRSQRDHHHHQPALIDGTDVVGDDWLIDDLQPEPIRKRKDLGGMLSSDSVRSSSSSSKQNKKARLTLSSSSRRTDNDSGGGGGGVHSEDELNNDGWLSPSPSSSQQHENRLTSSQDGVVTVVSQSRLSSSSSRKLGSKSRVVVCDGSDSSGEDERLPVLTHGARRTTEALVHNAAQQHFGGGDDGLLLPGYQQDRQEMSVSQGQPSIARMEGRVPHVSPVALPAAVVVTTAAPLTRVKVRIEGSVFLIPLPAAEEKTVGWLSEEASQRYSNHFGRRPLLTLSSSDGAILSTDDVLSAVLSSDEQLDASVHGWDQHSLSDRYAQACKTLNTVKYRNITVILKEAETSHQLSLSGLGLRTSILLPITRALRGEASLTHLTLPDNHLGDSGLQALAASLEDLKTLTHLNLAGNDITATGLRHLADLFLSATQSVSAPLQMLESFDVSHNPLGDGVADSLCGVVRGLPALTSLLLSACGFTSRLFQHNRPALARCLQERRLEHVDVSHNRLGPLGVEQLLRSLNPQKLISLDLGHTCPDPPSPASSSSHLALTLNTFLSQDCVLQSLSLENCSLNQEDVDFVCRLPKLVPSLQTLNVSVNKAVTRDSLHTLMTAAAQCPHSQMSHLLATAYSLTSALSAPADPSSSSSSLSLIPPIQPDTADTTRPKIALTLQ